ASGRVPLVVGGTGLYIRSLVEPLSDAPALDPARRQKLAAELSGKSVAELRRWCEALDLPRVHLGRTQLLRSIETALLSGTRLSDAHKRALADPPRASHARVRYLVIDAGEKSAQRIAERASEMVNAGWVEEVHALMPVVPADAPAWKSAGYAAMRSVASGELDLSSALEKVIIETRQYAKRQRTWFRHQLPADTVTRLDPGGSPAERRAAVREWWEKSE
ncbi:MAG TPA: tRNA dimethylallyltransferase, partial [Gemmatimonadaceae bacterium]|nr:tRNA dimethylallyltransferase [Gemmatimonadaceae bacterium]